jgi:glucose-1-phosphate cytidylyltransferase
MKVVILCGGEGTRLREETEFKPKPLVEIGGMPILWHIMKIYSHYGHKEFILPLGYKGELIKQFFINFNWRANDFTLDFMDNKLNVHENHKKEDWIIHFIDTGLDTKTALRLKKVETIIGDDGEFMLTYGDGVADIDINSLIEHHHKNNKIITLTGINKLSQYGIIEIDKNDCATEFKEKPPSNDVINGGFMVLKKSIFRFLNEKENYMFEEKTIPELALKKEVSIYRHNGFWHSMDTYRDYINLNKIWKEEKIWKIWNKND